MGASSSILNDQELAEFKKLAADAPNAYEIPTPPKDRSITDKKGFIVFGILMLILLPFLIYTLVKSDVRRLDHEVDNCGNICGFKNDKIKGLECSGKDYSDKPYGWINIINSSRSCSEKCPPGYSESDNSCYGADGFQGNITVTEIDYLDVALHKSWKYLIIFIITTVLCLLFTLMYRYFPGVLVWSLTILGLIATLAATGLFWYLFSKSDGLEYRGAFLLISIVLTVFSIVMVVIFIGVVKQIKLLILLFQETTKVLFAIPLIILLPILTLVLQVLVVAIFVITIYVMQSAAELQKNEKNGFYYYQRNGAMTFAMVFNLFVVIWTLLFFSGCQYMVIAGSVAHWFFKKDQVKYPLMISFTNTVRFHLGTVAFGSFILALVSFLKAVLKSLISNGKLRCLVDCCCGNAEAFLQFLSKSAYVQTAIHGQAFFKSGKRAANLIMTNLGSVISVNSIGSFVLLMTKLLLLAITTGIAFGIFSNEESKWALTAFAFFINLIVVIVVFGVFETIIDTLLLCYCEDVTLNDGSTRPYFMSKDLMQYVESSKAAFKQR